MSNIRLRACLAVAGSAVAIASVAPSANAAFDSAHNGVCKGAESISGIGSSFQRSAQLTWGAGIINVNPAAAINAGFGHDVVGCTAFLPAGSKDISYQPSGSGDGRGAFGAVDGANAGVRNPAWQFGGSDDAPTAAQIAAADAGNTGTTADNANLQIIPVSGGAITIAIQLPDGCQIAPTFRKLSRRAVDGAFAGSSAYNSWGEVFGTSNVSPASCRTKSFARVVRADSSGSTATLKDYLQAVVNKESTDSGTAWSSLGNTAWPNPSSPYNPVIFSTLPAPDNKGAGPLLDVLASTHDQDGGIGYADVATARDKGFASTGTTDTTFWSQIERIDDNTYKSPALSNAQVPPTGNEGAACKDVQYKSLDGSPLPTTSLNADWSKVSGVHTTADYPVCVLTFALAWDDPKPAGLTQGQARTVRDYVRYVTSTTTATGNGQRKLAPKGYSSLPDELPANLITIAQTGASSLLWNK